MKSIRLNNWQKTDDLDCLLFFALRSRELVFDFSLDSYKYPALNSATICAEAITLINEIENGNFAMKSLIPVLEELTNKLNSDIIAKYILGSDIEYYINFGDYTNIKEIKVKIEILLNKINPLKYKTIIEKRLLSLILENKEKRKIYEIATSYISTLINIGFSQSYINQCINKTFFSRASINDIAVLNSYFKLFEIKKETYKCIFSVSEIFEEIKTSSNVFKCEISDSLDAEIQQLDKKNFLKSKKGNEKYLIVSDVKALDPLSAKNFAEIRINKLSKLFVFFHHKKHPAWSEKALVIDSNNNSYLLNEKTSSMCKSSDCKPKKAAIKLNNLIQNLGLESSSFGKYNRIIDLHGLSVQNRIIENQLLQNWISFETLLVGYSKLSKIDQVINHILPFLLDSYVKSKLYTLAKSINKYDPRFFYNEIRMISDGDNLIQKFAALIVLEKYKENRRRFYNHLRYQPLAKFRLADFNKTFNNVELLTKHIDTHKTRVVWQIKRMYRTRNLIVHAGVVPNFTDALVENSHTYLDKVVNLINHMRINEHSIQSIEQAIKEVEIKENIYRKNLKQCKEINENNFSSILL